MRDEHDPLFGCASLRTVAFLGRGGMGEILEAEHVALKTRVVVKLLHAQFVGHPGLMDRMRLEAQTLAQLAPHPNLVMVHDFGATPAGRTYLVMERLYGRTLAEELDARGSIPIAEAIEMVRQVLCGLSAAHRAGIVHRDVKLENLFLCDANGQIPRTVKVLDFGIAKVLSRARCAPAPISFPTEEGVVVGTPRFLSPEQANNQPVDQRADLYAAGAVLYTLVAGRGPFDDAGSVTDLAKAHVARAPDPPSRFATHWCGVYEIVRFLGSGGMGDVFVARHPFTQMHVAIKCLLLKHSTRPDYLERMQREAVTLAKAKHPNIVLILDGGIIEGPIAYIVMELLEGQTVRQLLLGDMLPTPGRFDVRTALWLGFQATDALSAIHTVGIIHRDLKPENLFVVRGSGFVLKVIDFGLAKLRYNAARTTGGLVLGTPHYMSPEHLLGQDVDEKTDVYALCVILWEMIAGKYVFARSTDEIPTANEVQWHHRVATPKPLREQVPDCPEELSMLLGRGLSKDPAQRPTMAELGARLRFIRRRVVADAASVFAPSVPAPSGAAPSDFVPSDEPEDRASFEPALQAITAAMESIVPPVQDRMLREPDRLVVVVGPTPPAAFLLPVMAGSRVTIGRAEEAEISLNTPSVSRLHADMVTLGNGRYELVDRGSANGIQIEGATVSRSTIEAGAVFEVGDVRLRLEGAPPAPDEIPHGRAASPVAYVTTEESYPLGCNPVAEAAPRPETIERSAREVGAGAQEDVPAAVVAAPTIASMIVAAPASRTASSLPITPVQRTAEPARPARAVSDWSVQQTGPVATIEPVLPAWLRTKEPRVAQGAVRHPVAAPWVDLVSRPPAPSVAVRARAESFSLWIAPLLGLGVAVVMVATLEASRVLQATLAKAATPAASTTVTASAAPSSAPAGPSASSAAEVRSANATGSATEPNPQAEPGSTTSGRVSAHAGTSKAPPRATGPAPKRISKPVPAPAPIRQQSSASPPARPKPVDDDWILR